MGKYIHRTNQLLMTQCMVVLYALIHIESLPDMFPHSRRQQNSQYSHWCWSDRWCLRIHPHKYKRRHWIDPTTYEERCCKMCN